MSLTILGITLLVEGLLTVLWLEKTNLENS